jgi:hypothetical protein
MLLISSLLVKTIRIASFQIYRQVIKKIFYVSDGSQLSLFDLLATDEPSYTPPVRKVHKTFFLPQGRTRSDRFQLQNRRYLGNKYKLLGFIEDIVSEKCNGFESFCDIFADTGVVGDRFNFINTPYEKIKFNSTI